MKRIFIITISYFIVLQSVRQTNHANEQEKIKLEKEWHNAYKTKDTSVLIRVLAAEVINLNSIGNRYGKQAIINGLKTDNALYATIYPYKLTNHNFFIQ